MGASQPDDAVEFLTPAWAKALEDAANASGDFREACHDADLTIAQEIRAAEDDDRVVAEYALRFHDGELEVEWGSGKADVTFVQTRDVAEAMSRGELNAQQAFVLGKLRVRGDLERLLSVREAFSQLGDVFADVRARTTYPAR